ncbi:Trichothecene 3-O-acetyltransferase [Neonectria ditissima]|uniref:Trichothecene 3-O-acetyltransferase n=1 Tax=Neonectria ditissima TaxID=78410 RepID=A0A0P7AQX4_9HYPO|nr:Trichothecene 3-O-acetyltransferase [Neonectria ditissima]
METTTATSSNALDVELDVLGQQPLMRIYTQISFCFPVADPSAYPTIISTLEKGLERLSENFPWTAGQVVNEPTPDGGSGVYKIKPLDSTPRLLVKDLRDDPAAPTWDGLKRADFPMRMLDEAVVAPRNTLPVGPGYNPSDPEPVLLLQANYVDGGLVLTVNGQHGCMDMTGQGEVIRLLSKACSGDAFTEEELTVGNFPRKGVIPLLDESYTPGSELDAQIVQPPPVSDSKPSPPPPPPQATWEYFSFSGASLSALKSEASKSANISTGFISTDDALSALIWQCVTRARLPRLNPADETKFARAVDARGFVGAPKAYPGLLQNMMYNKSTLQQLVDEPLGIVALKLRAELEPTSLRHRTRGLATLMDRSPDKSMFNISASINPSADVMLSSWAKINCYELDFNFGLGKPESVRRPRFNPFECLMYLMPKKLDGEISLGISLREEDMERLKADEEFSKYGKYIG